MSLKPSEMQQLKDLIKAEMARRNGYGSLSTVGDYGRTEGYGAASGLKDTIIDYSSSEYDFTHEPTAGQPIYKE